MKKYEYMVVYKFGNIGVGRVQIIAEKPIESYADIESADNIIRKKNNLPNAFVTNFKLLREYEDMNIDFEDVIDIEII